MKLTFEPTDSYENDEFPHPTITISYPYDDLTIDKLWDDVIGPALLAWGFHKTTVKELRDDTIEEMAKND